MEAQPLIASVKHVLGRRGVPVKPDVRPPLRPLTDEQIARVDVAVAQLEPSAVRA